MSATAPMFELATARLRLSLLRPEDAHRAVAFYQDNRDYLAPWEPVRPEEFYSSSFWRNQLEINQGEFRSDQSVRLWIRSHNDDAVLGTCNLSNIVRGAFQACNIGYAVAEAEQGKGIMTEAVTRVTDYGFTHMNLHRIMANHIPSNERSARLLERLGFEKEGYAKSYLRIHGRWEDHILRAKTNPNWVAS